MSTTTTASQGSAGYRAWLLFLLVAIYTSNFVDRTILGVLSIAIKRDLGLSDTQIGMLGGLIFAVFYTLLAIPLARLAERTNRIYLMSVCVAIWSAMTAACGLAQNFWQLALARFGVGIGEAGNLPPAQSLISDYFPASQRGMALAIFSLGIPIGSLIGAVGGGWVSQNLDWRTAFFMVGLPGLALAILAPLTLKEPVRGGADVGGDTGKTPSFGAVFKLLASKPAVLWVCAGASFSAAGTYGVGTWLAPYFARRFEMDSAQAGLMAGMVSALPMLLSNLGGGLLADLLAKGDRRGYAWTSLAGVTIAAPLFVFGFMQSELRLAVIALFLAGIFQQAYLAPTFAVANNAAPARMRATTVAVLSFVWNLVGLGLGPLLVGVVSDEANRRLVASTDSDLLNLCTIGPGHVCTNPVGAGLSYALVVIVIGYVLGALCFLMSARHMRRDLQPV